MQKIRNDEFGDNGYVTNLTNNLIFPLLQATKTKNYFFIYFYINKWNPKHVLWFI